MTPQELDQNVAALEAVLFVHGEPLSRVRIAEMLDTDRETAEEVVREYEARLLADGRGLALLSSAERVQLVTKPAFSRMIERFVKDEVSEDLTPAALETLAVIAYLGPVSRTDIEYYRGVNSSFTLRNLLLRGLVSRVPDPSRPQSFLYESSFDLLRHLGIARREDLPEHATFLEALAKIRQDEQAEERPQEKEPSP